MAFNFRNFFFGQLPIFYKLKDSYKDINDRGLLERYLEIFGLEIDENLNPLIDNYLNIIDPFETDPKFLTTLSYTLGSPPDLLNDPDAYAKLLAYIIQVYKIKGTKRAFELLFSLLGFNVSINELPPDKGLVFDSGNLLDDGNHLDSGCPPCSDYEILILPVLNPNTGNCPVPIFSTVNNTILDTFIKIIEFNQPINANLVGLINGGKVCEEVNLCIENTITISLIKGVTLDDGNTLDNSINLDDDIILDSDIQYFDCSGGILDDGIGFMVIEDNFIIR